MVEELNKAKNPDKGRQQNQQPRENSDCWDTLTHRDNNVIYCRLCVI